MKRLGEFDNKVIIEQHNKPENKNVIWKDPDENKYKEYVDGFWVESKKIAAPTEPYELPIASADTLGGVKVGEGLAITENGVLSTDTSVIITGYLHPEGGFIVITDEQFARALQAYKSGKNVLFDSESSMARPISVIGFIPDANMFVTFDPRNDTVGVGYVQLEE